MARPATNHEARKAAIIEAALDCFTRYGYDGATNKRIAEAAGMKSAGIIYHYFPSKEDLFQACLERVSAFDTMRETLAAIQNDPPDLFLRKVGAAYLTMMREDQRLVRLFLLVFSSVHSHPELPPLALRRVVPAFIQPLFAYLQGQVELGVLRPLPPVSVALQLFGPLAMRAITNHLSPMALPVPQIADDVFVDTLVQTFLDGARMRGDAIPPEGGHSH
ncbi:MAG TPA: TetR/AcrR family transcriptional regulator [Ktedonobacterales bacterium]|jgi:AcrR family transcriptional regulator|nr:TetR/AcrR family transcriptional regulator [Ktedonobacterales bacterium]